MQPDLLLLPFEMNMLEIGKSYNAIAIYERLCKVVSWFDVSFETFMNTVKQYEQSFLGFETITVNEKIFIKRLKIDKKKLNERNIRQNTQRETIQKSTEFSSELFAKTQ